MRPALPVLYPMQHPLTSWPWLKLHLFGMAVRLKPVLKMRPVCEHELPAHCGKRTYPLKRVG